MGSIRETTDQSSRDEREPTRQDSGRSREGVQRPRTIQVAEAGRVEQRAPASPVARAQTPKGLLGRLTASAPTSPKLMAESGDGELEGMLVRKHEWESTTKKASNRSWEKICVVLKESQIFFYKDQKTYRSHPGDTFKGEPSVDLINCTAEVATDYTKKKFVFRLRLANGGFYLFQAADEDQMELWVNGINNQTLPPGSEKKDEPKRRSFFTLKKK